MIHHCRHQTHKKTIKLNNLCQNKDIHLQFPCVENKNNVQCTAFFINKSDNKMFIKEKYDHKNEGRSKNRTK